VKPVRIEIDGARGLLLRIDRQSATKTTIRVWYSRGSLPRAVRIEEYLRKARPDNEVPGEWLGMGVSKMDTFTFRSRTFPMASDISNLRFLAGRGPRTRTRTRTR
jgi:hypothetical protein